MNTPPLDRSTIASRLLRPLGGLERWFLQMDANHPNHFSIVAQLEGTITVDELVSSLRRIREKYPVLSCRISSGQDGSPCFFTAPGREIPLVRTDRISDDSWQRRVESEATDALDPTDALIRCIFLEGVGRSEVILTVHHAAADGMAAFYLMQDLLRGAGGEDLGDPIPSVSVEDLYEASGRATPPPPSNAPSETPPRPMQYRSSAADAPRFEAHLFSESETQRIREAVRVHHSTVHSALTSALVIAGRELSSSWAQSTVRVFTPINIRTQVGAGRSCSVILGAGAVAMESALSSDFWRMASIAQEKTRSISLS